MSTGNEIAKEGQMTIEISTASTRALPTRALPTSVLRFLLLLALLPLGACDYFEVTNPGPVQDKFLDDRAAHPAVVNGAVRALQDALNNVAYTTAAVTRELFPAGSTSSFGITPRQQQGILGFDDEHTGWLSHQRARAVAEAGYERFKEAIAPEPIDRYEPAGQIALWAGYAYRLLGENWCELTIDGGPAIPSSEALKHAERWFTTAHQTGQNLGKTELATAALAGRASVRAALGDWTGAVADAAQVPTGFVFNMKYFDLDTDQTNRIFWAGAGTPYKAHTVWRTVYQEYYQESKDPRVAWIDTGTNGDAAVMDLARVPFYSQQKHATRTSSIRLSSGREMRLIEAEARLTSGNWQEAINIINALRQATGVTEVTAANLEEAWTRLKRERGIELWLEGRRLHDLRRWKNGNIPGTLHQLELPGEASRLSPNQSLCYEIPKSERETNKNL
jgi:hypothetical protein